MVQEHKEAMDTVEGENETEEKENGRKIEKS